MPVEPIVSASALEAIVLGVVLVGFVGLVSDVARFVGRAAVRFHRAGMARLERYELAETVRRHPSNGRHVAGHRGAGTWMERALGVRL